MSRLDSRIREPHVARYGATDEVEDYLNTLEYCPPVPDDQPGEDHHILARSIWSEFSNLKLHPWNRLRVTYRTHITLTEMQAAFEDRLRFALRLMKGQSTGAYLESCRKGGKIGGQKVGKIQGQKNVESGHLARISRLGGRKTAESGHLASICSMGGKKGGKRTHELYPNLMSENGKKSGRKNVESGHLASICGIGNHTRWHLHPGRFNPACKFCFKVV